MKIVLAKIKISFLEEEEEVFESKPVITRKYIISIIIDIIGNFNYNINYKL